MTKVATIDKRKVLGLVMVAAMVIATLLAAIIPGVALADTEDTMSGQFALGNANPDVPAVGIYQHADNSTAVTSMNPNSEYIIKVSVSDANTLDDINTCNVTLFYDVDGDGLPATVPSDNYTHAVTLHWVVGEAAPTITSGSSAWWAVGAGSEAPSLTASSGDFCFHVMIGKCAIEALDWDAYAVVADDSALSDWYYDNSGYDVNWYGEISTSDAVNWAAVAANSDFAANKQTGKSVTYTANGDYDEQVAATLTWGTATLNAAGSPGANQFSIRVNDEDSQTGWQLLNDFTVSYATIDSTGIITDEDGDTVGTNTLWLKLGTPFVDNTYTGTIYFKIANG